MRYELRVFERIPTKAKPGKTHFTAGRTQRQLVTGYCMSLIQKSYHILYNLISSKTILGKSEENIQ